MSVPRKKLGETTTHNQAVLSAVHAPRPGFPCHCSFPVGSPVLYEGRQSKVVYNQGVVGADGTHWVKVSEGFHVPCGSLRLQGNLPLP